MKKTRLSVNVNKIATLRNARGGNMPDLLKVAADIERFGAEGITVHPRPDGRHIRYDDVYNLKKQVRTEFNIEGYPSDSFNELVHNVVPTQVTLVPDAPDALTSNAGWNTRDNCAMLRELVDFYHRDGIRVSIFVDADVEMVRHAAETGTDRIELYTERYARLYPTDHEGAIRDFVTAAREAQKVGLGLNAGHDLSLENLAYYHQLIPWTDEVSIGHALICDALYLGLHETIKQYLAALTK